MNSRPGINGINGINGTTLGAHYILTERIAVEGMRADDGTAYLVMELVAGQPPTTKPSAVVAPPATSSVPIKPTTGQGNGKKKGKQ